MKLHNPADITAIVKDAVIPGGRTRSVAALTALHPQSFDQISLSNKLKIKQNKTKTDSVRP